MRSAFFQCGMSAGPDSSTPDRRGVSKLFARLCCEQGSVAIETSISFMVLILFLFGIIECCMMGYTYASLEDAAREGVRYAIVHGTDSPSCSGPSTGCDATAANVKSDVTNYAKNFVGNLTTMVVTVSYPDGTSTAMSRVQVSVTQTYQPIFKVPGTSHVVTVHSAGRILY
jgi:Flp pilus assembly protein TadG